MTKIELACPRIYRFVYQIENDKTIYELLYKLIVYTLPSIWHYPFFHKCNKNTGMYKKQAQPKHVFFCCIVLPIGIAYWPCYALVESIGPVIPLWLQIEMCVCVHRPGVVC